MNGSSSLPAEDMEDLPVQTVAACAILGLSFVVGTPGNLLVIWTILRHVKKRSHIVLLILHLAVADLLVLITVPVWIFSFVHSWVFGLVACKITVYIIHSCMYSSVFFITVMSIERFIGVRYPFTSISWKKKNLLNKVLFVLWTLGFLFSIPVSPTQILDQDLEKEHCHSREYSSVGQEVACLLLETMVGFVIPFSILVICYSCLWSRIAQMTFKTKKNTMVLILSMVIVFALCWIPHHVSNILSLLGLALHKSHTDLAHNLESVRENMTFVTGALVLISSTVNPLLYVFAARVFRSSLRDTGIRKLFRYMSSTATGEGTKELSFISKRQRPSVQTTTNGHIDSEFPYEVPLSICEHDSS